MMDPTNDRKLEHIRIIEDDAGADRNKHWFDEVRLRHRALPECRLRDIEPGIRFLGKDLRFPLLISSMTGGEHELIQTINRNLALAAERCGVAMAVGSQRVMFTHPAARRSFDLRAYAPNTVLIGNVGAVQLNTGFGLEACQQAVDVLQGDGLYFHLNPLQEVIQPEGDTDFQGLTSQIGSIAAGLSVPVLAKEVGAGLSRPDAEGLLQQGVRHLDVAGTGGTSWSRIEHHRGRDDCDLGVLFQDWGIPTPMALQSLDALRPEAILIASGGIRSGLDMAKACVLGASLCGLASPFLQPAMESADAVIAVIEKLRREFISTMFLLGAPTMEGMIGHREHVLDLGRMRYRD